MMKFKINLRMKVFLIAVLVIVVAQVFFSVKNVQVFQNNYIEALKDKYVKLGGFLKSDVEKILQIGIPLNKLVKIEQTLSKILKSGPELRFIEITDKKGNVLYFANRNIMKQVDKSENLQSIMQDPETVESIKRAGLTSNDTNITIPIVNPAKGMQEGFINLHINPKKITKKSNQIFLDMITVILTSLLITFELLGFFVAYEISSPLKHISKRMDYSIQTCSPMPIQSFLFMEELRKVVDRFNYRILELHNCLTPIETAKLYFPKVKKIIDPSIENQIRNINKLLNEDDKHHNSKSLNSSGKTALYNLSALFSKIKQHINHYSESLKSFSSYFAKPGSSSLKNSAGYAVHFEFVRPLVFLFVMADGFSISFLPMYINTLYQPILGLPKEVVMALPISLFMLTLAIGMPLSGNLADKHGWYKTIIAGILLNVAGHLYTGLSSSLLQLILFRCITATGFAMVFMSCQKFIMANTTVKKRALGMSSFLAAFFSGDICGIVIGGMLVERIGFSKIFFLSGIFSLLTLLITFLIFHKYRNIEDESQKTNNGHGSFSFKKLFWIFNDSEFCSILFFQAIPAKTVLVGVLYYFVPLYLESIGVLKSNIGRIIICYGLSLVFLGPLFSRFFGSEKLRKYNVFIGGVITSIALVVFALNPSWIMVLIIVLLLGLAHTFSVSSQAALISETALVKKVGEGTGMGIFRFWERIGNIIGPIIVGYLIAKQGYGLSLTILGGLFFTVSIIYLITIIPKRR